MKINDLDNKSSYSNIVSIATKGKELTAEVYPNLFADNFTLNILTEKKTDVTIDVLDILVRSVRHFTFYTEGVICVPDSDERLAKWHLPSQGIQ